MFKFVEIALLVFNMMHCIQLKTAFDFMKIHNMEASSTC